MFIKNIISLFYKFLTFNLYYHIASICFLYSFRDFDNIITSDFISNVTFYHLSYYIGDSIYDYLKYDRFIYVIHHFIASFQYIILFNNRFNYDRDYLLIGNEYLLYIEYSSLVVNFRDVLKKEKALNLPIDYCFLFIYAYCRCYKALLFLEPINYHTELVIIPCIFYFISLMWTYNWANKLLIRTFKQIIKEPDVTNYN